MIYTTAEPFTFKGRKIQAGEHVTLTEKEAKDLKGKVSRRQTSQAGVRRTA